MSLPPSAVQTGKQIHDKVDDAIMVYHSWNSKLNPAVLNALKEERFVLCSAVADELERIAKLNSRTDMKLDLEIVIRTLRGQKEEAKQ